MRPLTNLLLAGLLWGCGTEIALQDSRDPAGARSARTLCRWLVDNGVLSERQSRDFTRVYLVTASRREARTSVFSAVTAGGNCGKLPYVRLEVTSSYASSHGIGYRFFDDTAAVLEWRGSGSLLKLRRAYRSGWVSEPPVFTADVEMVADLKSSVAGTEPSGVAVLEFRISGSHRTRRLTLESAGLPGAGLTRPGSEESVLPLPSTPSGIIDGDFVLSLRPPSRSAFLLDALTKRESDGLFDGIGRIESYP